MSSRKESMEVIGVDGRIIQKWINLSLLKKCSVRMWPD
jgi:hypothetical protein